jgi:hypothetical protein
MQKSNFLRPLKIYFQFFKKMNCNRSVTYNEWTSLDGVRFSTKWQFTDWTEAKGFTKIRGEAAIRNIRWIENTEGVFDIPKDSKKMDK